MTTSDNISVIEAIEKAMEGVTRGVWTKCGGATPYYTAIHSDHGYIIFGMADGQVHKERGRPINAPNMWEQQANATYIAACNPVAMSAILAEARKAEAMEMEIAVLRKVLAEASDAISAFADSVFNDNGDMTVNLGLATGDDYIRAYFADCRARTLLNGGSDAQG